MNDRRSAWACGRSGMASDFGLSQMNISRTEQRVLHVLALAAASSTHGTAPRPATYCVSPATVSSWPTARWDVFQRLRRKRLIASEGGGPYRISRLGRLSVRAQLDNQG